MWIICAGTTLRFIYFSMEMFGWTVQVCRCLWERCTCLTRRRPCTWSRWTLPCPSESCPAARSILWGTCPQHLLLVNVLPALARPRTFPNEAEPFWTAPERALRRKGRPIADLDLSQIPPIFVGLLPSDCRVCWQFPWEMVLHLVVAVLKTTQTEGRNGEEVP